VKGMTLRESFNNLAKEIVQDLVVLGYGVPVSAKVGNERRQRIERATNEVTDLCLGLPVLEGVIVLANVFGRVLGQVERGASPTSH